jgi:predicted CoA-binding protein
MTERKSIDDFLALNRIAVVGVSRRRSDFSRLLFHEFLARGYDAVPVNLTAEDIEGRRCFARVADISPPVEGVLLMTPPAVTERVVRQCADAGVKRIWMLRAGGKGAVSDEAVQFCHSQGIAVIPGECPFMFLPHAGLVHQLHGLVRKIAGSYPA